MDYTENTSVNLILSEINSTDSIQNEVISPYICFNKENYINSPIPISDCNLFFHYIRVKFFQFLKDVFDGQSVLLQFCIQLLEKINVMTKEQDRKTKTKLLLEILCMISIYRFHAQELHMVLNFYSHNLDSQYNNLFHPAIFFHSVKNILFDYYRMIANSNCVSTSLIEYKKIINHNSEKPETFDIKSSFDCLLRKTIFIPFFSNEEWGLTIPAYNLSFINIDIFCLQGNYKNKNIYPDYSFLFYFVKYIISFLYQPIGYNFKIYNSFNNNLETHSNTSQIKEDNKKNNNEVGYLMEALLIKSVEKINIEHVLFLLNETNWSLDHKIFLSKFKEIKEPNLENCMHLIENGKMMKELFYTFKITRNSIENAIKNNIILDIQYNLEFNKETDTIELKHRDYKDGKKNQGKEKLQTKRVCRIKSYY